MENIDCEKIYFVRSCYAEVLHRTQQPINKQWLQREQSWINNADVVLTDCPESNRAIKTHYNLQSKIALEYVNPRKFLEVTVPVFSKKAYYVGRFDKQKRFNLIQTPKDWEIIGIGRNELDERPYSAVKSIGVKPFEEYIGHMHDATFGLYPAVWESNGYSVQECLAMGKIPIIQKNSGGPERLCNHSNSIILDYESDLWYEKAMDLYTPQMHEAAKQTLTQKMFDDSLDKFAKVME
jgi:glycosyltransferase involved in cell wall biosynthesis